MMGCLVAPDAPEQWEASVTIESTPSGAQVVWFSEGPGAADGVPGELGATPLTWEVSRALVGASETVRLIAFKPGHGRAEVNVPASQLQAGEPLRIDVPRFASVLVQSDPVARFELRSVEGATIVDGEYTPRRVGELSPGVYEVEVQRVGWESHTETLTLAAGDTQRLSLALQLLDGPPEGTPRMSIRPGRLEGIDEESFYAGVVGQLRNLSNCYDRALLVDPAAEGPMRLSLTLNLDFGRVEDTQVLETAIDEEETIDCVRRRLRRVEFDAPAAESSRGLAELTLLFHKSPR